MANPYKNPQPSGNGDGPGKVGQFMNPAATGPGRRFHNTDPHGLPAPVNQGPAKAFKPRGAFVKKGK
jgi:hypothetical protein